MIDRGRKFSLLILPTAKCAVSSVFDESWNLHFTIARLESDVPGIVDARAGLRLLVGDSAPANDALMQKPRHRIQGLHEKNQHPTKQRDSQHRTSKQNEPSSVADSIGTARAQDINDLRSHSQYEDMKD
eukprot:CAMPEP_0113678008 /NCGR_PEP_ID=MMETSP0038_2-20120614/9648_1 /TAXON_ID=2898 /ORGANISM="Cryptomonas paramecium" /LENGTH=128 /DNA_ID=CAMNT_0000595477 /DNA_START=291 /DNA_END=678 /DNA_ORIENTATION=+ /assembly_acc=CAM_ASM_000170